jgi:hypothetical protein
MPKMLSTEGPFMAVGDVNGDGLDDAFIGGAKEQAGRLLLQGSDGAFVSSNEALLERDRFSEDLGAAFFDAEGDGDLDLYVVSGGSEFSDQAPALKDRLYLNEGGGRFRKAEASLPGASQSGSRVVAHDFDADGDIDLFVGGRVVPWRYGFDPPSALLRRRRPGGPRRRRRMDADHGLSQCGGRQARAGGRARSREESRVVEPHHGGGFYR